MLVLSLHEVSAFYNGLADRFSGELRRETQLSGQKCVSFCVTFHVRMSPVESFAVRHWPTKKRGFRAPLFCAALFAGLSRRRSRVRVSSSPPFLFKPPWNDWSSQTTLRLRSFPRRLGT